jgi:hypothetical protein
MIRLMDAYAKRGGGIESHRLQDVRHSALRLVAEIDKVLKERGDEVPAPRGGKRTGHPKKVAK